MNPVDKARFEELGQKVMNGRLTKEERGEMDVLLRQAQAEIAVQEFREKNDSEFAPAPRFGNVGAGFDDDAPSTRGAEVRGAAHELLSAGQSVRSWYSKAAKSGNIRHNGTDRDIERYWAERFGFKPATVESRALGEGTSSGSGAGAALVPEEWSADFVDLLRANLVLSDAQPGSTDEMPGVTVHGISTM